MYIEIFLWNRLGLKIQLDLRNLSCMNKCKIIIFKIMSSGIYIAYISQAEDSFVNIY